jgi:hypothetical protein
VLHINYNSSGTQKCTALALVQCSCQSRFLCDCCCGILQGKLPQEACTTTGPTHLNLPPSSMKLAGHVLC